MSQDDPTPLQQFTQRLRDEPKRGAATFRASTTLGPGYRCEAAFRRHSIVVDEPPSIGGTGEGPNPIELFLGSVATCQAIAYRIWAENLGIALDEVDVDIEGDVELGPLFGTVDDGPRGYTSIRLDIRFRGPESDEQYDELARAVERACPLLDTLRTPVELSLRTSIER